MPYSHIGVNTRSESLYPNKIVSNKLLGLLRLGLGFGSGFILYA